MLTEYQDDGFSDPLHSSICIHSDLLKTTVCARFSEYVRNCSSTTS